MQVPRLQVLCVQRLRFVPPWLTPRQRHTDSILTSLYEKLRELS